MSEGWRRAAVVLVAVSAAALVTPLAWAATGPSNDGTTTGGSGSAGGTSSASGNSSAAGDSSTSGNGAAAGPTVLPNRIGTANNVGRGLESLPDRTAATNGGTNTAGTGSAPGATQSNTAPTYPVPNGSGDVAAAPAPPPAATTQLTIVIARSTVAGHNGQFTLTCNPTGGTHPDPVNACAKLTQLAASGTDPFAATPKTQMCSMISGGPATARIAGTWQGRRVDATFSRTNSCQTARWNNLLPILSPESAT